MRRVLITLAIVIVCAAATATLWIFVGRHLSQFVDQSGTVETASIPVKTIRYEGSGTGGTLFVNDIALSLSTPDQKQPPPNIGTTKEDDLALSFGGKVFAFGPAPSGGENLATELPAGDEASLSIQHSTLSWPSVLESKSATERSPSKKRHLYYKLIWKKPTGAKLEMLWRYEQNFYPDGGWSEERVTREGSTGLIRVEIQSPQMTPAPSA